MARTVSVGAALRRSAVESSKLRLIGGNASDRRQKDDFYPTPSPATIALLNAESFEGDILEPACGEGDISRLLEKRGFTVRSTDLVDRGYGEPYIDFIGISYPYRAANVITNPPFKLGTAFARRALEIASRKVAILHKLAFLETAERAALFAETPLARVWVFSRRLMFPIPHQERQVGGMLAFAWFVWDHAHSGPPTLGWLS
jgi:hypothetical protein